MTSDPDRWIGRRIGAYEIVALIGAGGMGSSEHCEKSATRFRDVASHISLEYPDRTPMDEAIAGLEQSTREIERLQSPGTRRPVE